MNPNDRPWSFAEICELKRCYATTPAEIIAHRLGRSLQSVYVYANKLGLKKPSRAIVWTDAQIAMLRRYFPTMFNRDLCKLIGVSQRTMIRKARELGIVKVADFRERNFNEMNRRASRALKQKYETSTCVSHFKKGERKNIAGEFKAGHVESAETKAKRVESLKRTWASKKIQARIAKQLNIPTYEHTN